jgi:hypothetical protein
VPVDVDGRFAAELERDRCQVQSGGLGNDPPHQAIAGVPAQARNCMTVHHVATQSTMLQRSPPCCNAVHHVATQRTMFPSQQPTAASWCCMYVHIAHPSLVLQPTML